MRLIDADKFKQQVALVLGLKLNEPEKTEKMFALIDNQPTVNAVSLPCKVGDTVYVLTTDSPTGIEKTKVYQINSRFTNNRVFHKILCKCVYDDWGNARWEFAEKDFGKSVFLTKSEAEQALKEMEGLE